MSRGTVYLGGPITGLTWSEAAGWRSETAGELLRVGWKFLNPMRGEQEQFGFGDEEQLPSTFAGDREACMRDLFDIDRSDVTLFNFKGAERVSVGSTTEMGYAYGRAKFILTILEEGSPHDHLFVKGLSSAIVPDLAGAIDVLKGL